MLGERFASRRLALPIDWIVLLALLAMLPAMYASASTAPADFIVESRGGANFANYADSGFLDMSASVGAPGCLGNIGSRYANTTSSGNWGPSRHATWRYTPEVTGYYTVSLAWSSTYGQKATAVNIYTGANTGSTVPDRWGNLNGPQEILWSGTKDMYFKATGIWNECGKVLMHLGIAHKVGIYAGYLNPYSGGVTPIDNTANRIVAGAAKFAYSGPAKAEEPSPADDAVEVSADNPTLSWTAGSPTDTYDVYFGTGAGSMTKVVNAQPGASYCAGTLGAGVTYFWRIDSTYGGKTTTGDVWSFTTASPDPYMLTLTPNPANQGHCLGAGRWPAGPVAISAVANTNYHFVKWTTDLEGAVEPPVSTEASFDYDLRADTTLYAQFAPDEFAVAVSANPAAGGSPTIDGGASHGYDTPVTVRAAAPSEGYCFVNWTTNADGTGIVSRKPNYTFTMPANSVTLYANYARALFVEGFEGLVRGVSRGLGTLDMNYTFGDNQAANGDMNSGNPWWGTKPYNGSVGCDPGFVGATARTGQNALWSGYAGDGRNYLNIAYRLNGGAGLSTSPIYIDWWFYDPWGTGWNLALGSYCDDPLSLAYTSAIPTDTDYPARAADNNFEESEFLQKISLGMASDWCAIVGTPGGETFPGYMNFDHTRYQARIKNGLVVEGSPASYANGWYNVDVTRSVGWHHGRIVVGAAADAVSPVKFYLDNMAAPVLAGAMQSGLNLLELATMWKPGNTPSVVNWPDGAMYDDITIGRAPMDPPATPGAAAASDVTTNAITWNWTQSGTADGFRVYDVAALGAHMADTTALSLRETGLAANTPYSRWVVSYHAPVFESTRRALTPTYTLAPPPDSDWNAATTATGAGVYNLTNWPGLTNPQGFGTGNKVSSFKYKWSTSASGVIADDDPDWSSGTLMATPSSDGVHYLYLRSYNAAGVGGDTARFGPFTFHFGIPVAKISDLWPLANGPAYQLINKAVTGVVGGAFWIEECDRSAALKVIYDGIVTAGHVVDVIGALDSSSGQRVLVAGAVADRGALAPANAIRPLVVTERSAGGRAVNANTPSVAGGSGLYNVGMLVRIAGRVGGAGVGFFYLDDGSGLTDGENAGIKVLCGVITPPASGTKTVTGMIGVEDSKPILTVRGAGDIQ